MRKSRNCSLTVETGSLQRSRSSHSTPGSSPSYAGGPPCVSKNHPSWKSLNPSSSHPSRHSLLASWPMTYWWPVSWTMRPMDALPSRITTGSRERGAVPVALILDPERRVGLRVVPTRVAFHRDAGGADHLVLGEVESDVEGGELAVELAPRVKRVVLPAVAVVHHHFGIPLREIEAPALAPLASRQGGRARLPVDLHRQRVAGNEGPRQGPVRDGRVGGIRVVGSPCRAHDGRAGDALERVVRVLQVLKPLALLGRIGGGPAGAGPEGIEVLVDVEIAQRVRRPVHIADPRVAGEHARRLVQGRGDLIRELLLPVGGCVAGNE